MIHTATKTAGVTRHHRVAIVGAGFGGLATAIRLRDVGIDDFVIFERGDDVGGTWRVNRYPGAACDVQSRLYELARAPNHNWTRRYAQADEIWEYLRTCADRFDLRRHTCFAHDVERAAWDDGAGHWRLATSGGTYTADVLVAAAGALAEPHLPDIAGLASFPGTLVHTSTWGPHIDVTGLDVAVVGTGASAVQLVPAIAETARRITVFQRTPPWIIPRMDRPLSSTMADALRRAPWLHSAIRAALFAGREMLGVPFRHPWVAGPAQAAATAHLHRQVSDERLRRVLTPAYRIGCKRVLSSDDYYPALCRDDVTLVDGALVQIDGDVLTAADGTEQRADVLVVATGFEVTEPAFARRVTGRGGQWLSARWTPSMRAHVGTTVPGFPNLFVLLGPNTGLGHNSVVLMIEAQVEHVLNALRAMDDAGAATVEPYREAQAAYVAEVELAMQSTVWTTGGCNSWYLDETGRNTTLWPGSVTSFRRRVEPFRTEEYLMRGTATTAGPAVAPTPFERARGFAARAVLPRLRPGVAARLGGGSTLVDGVQFDPWSRLVIAARGGESTLTVGTPAQARIRNRREILSGGGNPTPVRDVDELQIDGAEGLLPARLYRSTSGDDVPLLVYFHGGGFVLGDLDTADEECRVLCAYADQPVLSVAYRLAPEHPFPAGVHDAVAALRWAQTHASELGGDGHVAVGGASAGGNLAAVAARLTADHAPAAAQLLIYPATDRARAWPSKRRYDGYFLSAQDMGRFTDWYGGDDADPDVSPLRATALGGLPAAYTVTAGFDVLSDEGRAYAGALAAAGTPSAADHAATLGHGFMHLTRVSPAARAAAIATAQRWRHLLTRGWPTR